MGSPFLRRGLLSSSPPEIIPQPTGNGKRSRQRPLPIAMTQGQTLVQNGWNTAAIARSTRPRLPDRRPPAPVGVPQRKVSNGTRPSRVLAYVPTADEVPVARIGPKPPGPAHLHSTVRLQNCHPLASWQRQLWVANGTMRSPTNRIKQKSTDMQAPGLP